MAEMLFAHLAPDLEVGSAGTMDWSGQPAHEYAIAAMAERGLDLSAHRSRRLSEYLVDESDLIVAMTRNHGWAVAARSEAKAAATFLPAELSRLADQAGDRNGADAREWVSRLHTSATLKPTPGSSAAPPMRSPTPSASLCPTFGSLPTVWNGSSPLPPPIAGLGSATLCAGSKQIPKV